MLFNKNINGYLQFLTLIINTQITRREDINLTLNNMQVRVITAKQDK